MSGDLFDWGGDSRSIYPATPGTKEHRIGGASRKAAERIAPAIKTLRALVLARIKADGPLTADETADRLGIDVLSIRPRCSELVRLGLLIPTEQRRPSSRGTPSTVWKAAAP